MIHQLIVALALALPTGEPQREDDPASTGKDLPQLVASEGRVIAMTKEAVAVADKDGNEMMFELSADTKVVIEGQGARPEALKPGMHVRVSTAMTAPTKAVRIEVNHKR